MATAGTSQQALGILGGFDATPATVAPFVEPLFGTLGSLIPVLVDLPAPGACAERTPGGPGPRLAGPTANSLFPSGGGSRITSAPLYPNPGLR
ncbi:MAG: hypothetical protein JNK49_10005 [Planctomycetes bacterium]|nr:hypothetical protein [Planctomycetota bacterium]